MHVSTIPIRSIHYVCKPCIKQNPCIKVLQLTSKPRSTHLRPTAMTILLRLAALAAAVTTASAAAAPHGCKGEECTHEPPDTKVTVLNAGNFHRFIKRHPLTLMEFYAPWCGHCQDS